MCAGRFGAGLLVLFLTLPSATTAGFAQDPKPPGHHVGAPADPVADWREGGVGDMNVVTVSGARCNLGHAIEHHRFDWGDGAADAFTAGIASHSWSKPGFISVTVVAVCTGGLESAPSAPLPVTITKRKGPGVLAVDAGQEFWFSGPKGGPFSPTKFLIRMRNVGGEALEWSFKQDSHLWLDASPTFGNLEPGAEIELRIAPNDTAVSLIAGNYYNMIRICMGDQEVATRPAVLTVGSLVVASEEEFNSEGAAGGPFAPSTMTYRLINSGVETVRWEAPTSEDWIALSATEGDLEPGMSFPVTLSITPNANLLPPGTYSTLVEFRSPGGIIMRTYRAVRLGVSDVPPLPAEVQAESEGQTGGGGGGCGLVGLEVLLLFGLLRFLRRFSQTPAMQS